jgi:hypothetical protein
VDSLAATMNLPADTLSDEIEPFLAARAVHRANVARPGGDARSYETLGRKPKPPPRHSAALLFD